MVQEEEGDMELENSGGEEEEDKAGDEEEEGVVPSQHTQHDSSKTWSQQEAYSFVVLPGVECALSAEDCIRMRSLVTETHLDQLKAGGPLSVDILRRVEGKKGDLSSVVFADVAAELAASVGDGGVVGEGVRKQLAAIYSDFAEGLEELTALENKVSALVSLLSLFFSFRSLPFLLPFCSPFLLSRLPPSSSKCFFFSP